MSGEKSNLSDDNEILKINSPRDNVGGPYIVVYKCIKARWAIVAMEWDDDPRLGIRWFWGKQGHPVSTHHPVWFVVPPQLSKSILAGLPLKHAFGSKVDKFLAGDISGNDLAS